MKAVDDIVIIIVVKWGGAFVRGRSDATSHAHSVRPGKTKKEKKWGRRNMKTEDGSEKGKKKRRKSEKRS